VGLIGTLGPNADNLNLFINAKLGLLEILSFFPGGREVFKLLKAQQRRPYKNWPFRSLRGEKRRGNLIEFHAKPRLLRCARNDNVGVFRRSRE
jgi:hypothetical protein